MTILQYSAARLCRARPSFIRPCIWPSLKDTSRSIRALSTPSTTLFTSSHHTNKSELITKPDPSTIYPDVDYTMRFAGKSRGSTADSGSGVALSNHLGDEVWWAYQQLGGVSKNEADYISLITGLQCARTQGVQRIIAQGCNDLLFRQMEGTNKVRKESLREYYAQAISLSKEFESFQLREIDKTLNKRAIQLAEKGMKMQVEEDDKASVPGNDDSKDMQGSVEFEPSPSVSSNINERDQTNEASISPEKTYVLRFDGGSRGNPGIAGAGMVLYDSEGGSEIWSACQYIGDRNTNNEAEYMGLITGLQCARSLGINNIVVQGDSQLILRQVDGKYQVKSPLLKDYYNEAMSLSREFASFQTSHILRARNGRADELANEAMDTRQNRGFDVS